MNEQLPQRRGATVMSAAARAVATQFWPLPGATFNSLSSSILSRRACTICMVTPKEDYSICRAQLWKWKQDLVVKTLVNLLSRERWIAVLQAESSDRYSHWIRLLWPDSLAYQCHDALRSTQAPKDKQETVLGRFQWQHLEAREKRTNIERIGKHIAHSRYLPTCRQKIHAESTWMMVTFNDRTKQTDSSIVLTLHPFKLLLYAGF